MESQENGTDHHHLDNQDSKDDKDITSKAPDVGEKTDDSKAAVDIQICVQTPEEDDVFETDKNISITDKRNVKIRASNEHFVKSDSLDCIRDSSMRDMEKGSSIQSLDAGSYKEHELNKSFSSSTPALNQSLIASKEESERISPMKGRSESMSCLKSANQDGRREVRRSLSVNFDTPDKEDDNVEIVDTDLRASLVVTGSVKVPIVGYEIKEARSRYTVYKIHVRIDDEDESGWFVFRRYSDFDHLNNQLRQLFPNVRLLLPPKRWIRSNFDEFFLEERRTGLQCFLNNVMVHRNLANSSPVRDFFCFDDPPGPYESLEDSRAQCEFMEEKIYTIEREMADKDTELELLKEELDLYKSQVKLLTSRLSELNHFLSERTADKEKIDTLFGSGPLIKENGSVKTK